jgi:hypothetical protein
VTDICQTEVLESLRGFGNNPRYGKIEQEYTSTLTWIGIPQIARGPGFMEWLQNDESLFWISGKPGAGKSTLMKYIHDHEHTLKIMSSAQLGRVILVSFFFHELGIPSEKTFSGLLHALLAQLLTEIPELIPIIYPRFLKLQKRSRYSSTDESIWSETELQGAFWDILRSQVTKASILCIIDGLDECEQKSLHKMLQFLLKLSVPSTSCHLRFKILCSGRPENALEIAFSRFPILRVQEYTSGDIKKFITESLGAFTRNLHPNDGVINISHDIIRQISSKANGVFIWARLVVAEIILAIEAGDVDELDNKLKQLPSDLEDLYARIVEKLPVSVRHHTFNHLQLLLPHDDLPAGPENLLGMTLGMQPRDEALKSQEITMTKKDKISSCVRINRVLRERCRGFINLPSLNSTWDEELVFKLFCLGEVSIHKTVQDYLFTDNRAERLCSEIDYNQLEDRYEQRGAYYFRLLRVDLHTQRQTIPRRIRNELDISMEALNSNVGIEDANCGAIMDDSRFQVFEAVFRQLLRCLNQNEFSSAIPLAPLWLPIIETYLKRIFSVDQKLENFYDAMMVPNYFVFEETGEDPATSPWSSNLLSLAIYFELYSYAREKLRELEQVQKRGRPLLHYFLDSSFSRPGCIDMIRLLLSKGCQPGCIFNSRTTWEYFLITFNKYLRIWAAWRYDDVILLLLKYGADPNQHINFGNYECLALHIMLSKHSLPYDRLKTVLEEFLRLGAIVTEKDSNGVSALELANTNWPQAVKMLVSHSTRDQTPLDINKAE